MVIASITMANGHINSCLVKPGILASLYIRSKPGVGRIPLKTVEERQNKCLGKATITVVRQSKRHSEQGSEKMIN